jgi:DNA-binding transcriptional LysR family regulator
LLLRRHNLNLLPILRELLRTRSVSRTARNIGLSQSAVSAALARLREIYQDEILAPVGRRLQLTERGEELIEQAEEACLEIEALLRPNAFDPATEERRFVVATADYVAYLMAPHLARIFAERAPNAAFQFIDMGPDLATRFVRGAVDVLIMPEDTAGPSRTHAVGAPLFTDETVVIASRALKPFEGPLTLAAYESARHATFQLSARPSPTHEDHLRKKSGVRHRDVVFVEQFLTLPAVVEASNCLALVQRRLAERFARNHDIELHAPPFPAEPMVIAAYWRRARERDPAHAWFRGVLLEASAALPQRAGRRARVRPTA